jgi:serine phosphatase RsbU (regulator of sigma subunit)
MSGISLKALLRPKSASFPVIAGLCQALGDKLSIEDAAGKSLLGESSAAPRVPVELEGATLGYVIGPEGPASALALLLTHLAAREAEGRALAAEVLHLYREVHLIEQLSEQLAAILNLSSVGESALAQARRLITSTNGCILVTGSADGPLSTAAAFGSVIGPLSPDSNFTASLRARGIAEIVNDCAADPRANDSERRLGALICAPLRAGQRTVGIIALANDAAGAVYSTADLKLLNTIALQTAAAIENSLLAAEMVGAARDREQLIAIQKELDTARTIQHLLVPRTFPPFPERKDFELHAQMTSARAVGGDFFDFFLIDEDRLGIVIGDVSGKGIPAALFMAVTRTQVKTTAQRGMPPAECFLEVNRVLVQERVSAMFATCFYGLLNLKTGEFDYCSAGHNPPYLLRANAAAAEPISEVGGIPLGLFDGMGYTGSTMQLRPGDSLFLYTDGVPEAQNIHQDDLSDERLMAILGANSKFNCKDLIHSVTREVSAFTGDAPQSDDITMLSFRLAEQ